MKIGDLVQVQTPCDVTEEYHHKLGYITSTNVYRKTKMKNVVFETGKMVPVLNGWRRPVYPKAKLEYTPK